MSTEKSSELLSGVISDLTDMAWLSTRSKTVDYMDTLISAYLAICAHWLYVRRSEGVVVAPEFNLSYNSPLLKGTPTLKIVDAANTEIV